MRRILLLIVVGCGGRAVAPPANTAVAPPPQPVVIDAPADCASRVEDWQPGNHDRFRFVDPATQLAGYKNAAGTVVIPARLRFAYEFGPGGVAAAVDGDVHFVFLDTAGHTIARAFAFDNGPDYFQEGVARIVDARGKIGFVTERGAIAIPPKYDAAEGFCHGTAEVTVDGATFRIDRHGRRVR